MFIPAAAVSGLAKESDTALSIAGMFNDPFGLSIYNIVLLLLIVIFTYTPQLQCLLIRWQMI